MQIQIEWDEQTPRIVAASVLPYPDLRRLWLRVALSPFGEYPNLDMTITDPVGRPVASASMIELRQQELALTLHLSQPPQPDAIYQAHLVLSHGGEERHRLTVDFPLTFVEPTS